jgi:hypothetical protein
MNVGKIGELAMRYGPRMGELFTSIVDKMQKIAKSPEAIRLMARVQTNLSSALSKFQTLATDIAKNITRSEAGTQAGTVYMQRGSQFTPIGSLERFMAELSQPGSSGMRQMADSQRLAFIAKGTEEVTTFTFGSFLKSFNEVLTEIIH